MSFLSFFVGEKKKTASVAKERLQIILAHERSGRNASEPDYLPALQRELIDVISKYIKIDPKDIKVNLEHQGTAGFETETEVLWGGVLAAEERLAQIGRSRTVYLRRLDLGRTLKRSERLLGQ